MLRAAKGRVKDLAAGLGLEVGAKAVRAKANIEPFPGSYAMRQPALAGDPGASASFVSSPCTGAVACSGAGIASGAFASRPAARTERPRR